MTSKDLNGSKCTSDDDIVITGMSGKFPCSRNIKEFENNLYNKVNMITDEESRWLHSDPKIPKHCGTISGLTKFDSQFFGINHWQAHYMDPLNRILLEESFKALIDAGINPFSIRGSSMGVYIGAFQSESERYLFTATSSLGFAIAGCSRAMLANRISYMYGLEGPSLECDTAGLSSMTALNLALGAMKSGEIDSAIVGGANLCLHSCTSIDLSFLGVLTEDGICRPFDAEANGYVRSEAISCIVLQRKSVAKRIYATLVNCKINCDGFKTKNIIYPYSAMQQKLMNQIYDNFDLNNLGFMEAHCAGTAQGDPEECDAIDKAICRKRRDTLLIGSIKSNCGHTEATSGITSIVKVLLTFQNNWIPPNINMNTINPSIEALKNGRMTVVTEATKLEKPYVGINSFGFGGTNGHALLKRFDKEKVSDSNSENQLPRLVIWASRTEENTLDFLTHLENQPLDEEYLALISSAQLGGVKGMVFRGFSLLQPNGGKSKPTLIFKKVQHYSSVRPPIVWVFSGMGSQWAGMGKTLMILPLFKKSIQRCHNTLKPLGMDLINIITTDDPHIFDLVLNSFVGIAAIQIALVDILRELAVIPDYIIGHSVGELGCAYADNCFTPEQMILAAYYRGKVSVDMGAIKGSMAAIGLGYNAIKPLLPESIEVACHNNSDSSTISGPSKDVEQFVDELKAKNVFARLVPSSNIAYHSRYIAHFGPELLNYLKQILPNPKERSSKWISSSVPESNWDQEDSLYSSAEYHANNLLNSVLFEEAVRFLPKNALTIEVSPHGLLQSILKGSMPDGIHFGLTKRGTPDGTSFLLNALGNLYCNGVELNLANLYPKVQWPVSRGTQSLSHLIEFDHSTDHFTYLQKDHPAETLMKKFALNEESYAYLKGHEIDGRVLVPYTYYLECVWHTFAVMNIFVFYESVRVEFEDVRFLRATTILPKCNTVLTVVIHKGTGIFEIRESESLICTGLVRKIEGATSPRPIHWNKTTDVDMLMKVDFYKELWLRGYHYQADFQAVDMASADGTYGKVRWTNWVSFMDSMLQLSIVGHDSRSLMLPKLIRMLRIFPEHQISMGACEPDAVIEVFRSKNHRRIVAGGVEIFDVKYSVIEKSRAPVDPVLQRYQFLPHFPAPKLSLLDVVSCCIQLIAENQSLSNISVIEVMSDKKKSTQLLEALIKAIGELPLITSNYTLVHKKERPSADDSDSGMPGITEIYANEISTIPKSKIVVASHVSTNELDCISFISAKLESNGFVICREAKDFRFNEFKTPKGFLSIGVFPTDTEVIVLLQSIANVPSITELKFITIKSSDLQFKWIKDIKSSTDNNNVVLVSQNDKYNGILGLVNCLRKEPDTTKLRCVLIDDADAPPFAIDNDLYAKQLNLGLAINVYRKGHWGTYRYLLLPREVPITRRSDHVFASILHTGDLSSLRWIQGPLSKDKFSTKIIYSTIGIRDLNFALGQTTTISASRLEEKNVFGYEYSGIDLTTGKYIMGISNKGAVTSYIEKSSQFCWEVPKAWSLRDAATVPLAYLTVYYAFFCKVDIREGHSILIHAGSGGIGLAAIRVALAYGLEVFTTVSSAKKKAFLLKSFPQLLENHIGNSRDNSFEDMIKDHTDKGVDFVLNSLTQEKLLASIRCLGNRGKFLEIGKFDMDNDNKMNLGHFLNELSFYAILIENLLTADVEQMESLKDLLSKDIARGIVQPLPSTKFIAQEIEQAFRFLSSGKHTGKVVIQIYEDPSSETTMPIAILPRVYFSENLVYIIPGGLEGFGLEFIDWMVLRGARKIVISSRRGVTNAYQKSRINLWKTYGCQIEINISDISACEACLKLIRDSMKMGPIGGIFNLAVQLKDALFGNQTEKLHHLSFAPKALATLHLDEISRKLCQKLQHFIVFSSSSYGCGRTGQSNNSTENSIMERIIENRIAHGLPGKAIQWGAVGEVGVAEVKIDLDIGGILQQRISSCLNVLDNLISAPDAIVSSVVIAEKSSFF